MEVARSWNEIDRLDRIATIGGLAALRLSALRLEREHARLKKRDRVLNLVQLLVARDRRRNRWGNRISDHRDRDRCDRHGFGGRRPFILSRDRGGVSQLELDAFLANRLGGNGCCTHEAFQSKFPDGGSCDSASRVRYDRRKYQ